MRVVHLLHGLPGTGKTTFAQQLKAETGAILLNHDEFMTAAFGNDPPAERFQEYCGRVHALIWSLTDKLILQGIDVVLDHGFWTRASRDEARTRVRAMGAIPRFYWMVCADSIADKRVLKRSQTLKSGVLNIDQHALNLFRTRYEPMGDDEECTKIDTDQPCSSTPTASAVSYRAQDKADCGPSRSKAEAEVARLARERSDALVRKDLVNLERILAPDFTYINASGEELVKSTYLERYVRSADVHWEKQELDHITASGDLIVRYSWRFEFRHLLRLIFFQELPEERSTSEGRFSSPPDALLR